jgi:hypothetical protein
LVAQAAFYLVSFHFLVAISAARPGLRAEERDKGEDAVVSHDSVATLSMLAVEIKIVILSE